MLTSSFPLTTSINSCLQARCSGRSLFNAYTRIFDVLFRIVKSNSELFTRLDAISSEIRAKKTEFKDINGYRIINKRVKQFLNAKPVVEKLFIAFKDAMERFKEE